MVRNQAGQLEQSLRHQGKAQPGKTCSLLGRGALATLKQSSCWLRCAVEERGALDGAPLGIDHGGASLALCRGDGQAQQDVSADIRGALKPHHGKHFAAITDPAKLGELIRAIRGYQAGR
ncbi:MAG: hypothetical protein IPH35_13735 [Rhodoferax sp.]|nr:hypothetical protein [Rhodoferax sp.]